LHIHSYLYFLSNQALIAKILGRGRAVLQIHGGVGPPPYRASLTRLAVKWIYDKSLGTFTISQSDLVASVSKIDLDYVSKNYQVKKDRLRYVPNLVDTQSFTNAKHTNDDSENVILYVGDFESWKGINSLIDWSQDSSWNVDYELTLRFIGQGSFLHKLLELEKRTNSTGQIHIEVLGPKKHEEIPSYMKSAKALILPSFWEGMPTVILEAMACGIPVIATPVGDIPNVITNMQTGFLINRSLESFQQAITTVLFNDRAVHKIVANARQFVEDNFSLNIVKSKVDEIYREISF
jgi:glycosyltransferase involved in cell wall biosynthesis